MYSFEDDEIDSDMSSIDGSDSESSFQFQLDKCDEPQRTYSCGRGRGRTIILEKINQWKFAIGHAYLITTQRL
jgi:hypothetical protein